MVKKSPDGLVISPLENGTVIDHITPGEGLTVLRILNINNKSQGTFTLACNVSSSHGGRKDIVKIANRELSCDEVDKIALVAPDATISIIRNRAVAEKNVVTVPDVIEGVIRCPNPNCITNSHEPVETKFVLHPRGFRCAYCDTIISRSADVGKYI